MEWLLIVALLGLGVCVTMGACGNKAKGHPYDEAQDITLQEDAEDAVDDEADSGEASGEETLPPTQHVRVTIRSVRHDMNPVTLRSWTRLVCDGEDGTEHKMSFDGENGMYLAEGDTGILEHRDGVFVSFEKDTGEVVAILYHIPAEEA